MEWFKIVCNILDHRKIKMIRKGPEGNTLVLLWLLMLAEAGKCNRGGYLMISDSLQYTAETLGMVTDIPLPTVQLGLRTYSGLGMIDQQDGAIFIRNWSKYQSEDKLEARREMDRVRKARQRQRERDKILVLPVLPEKSRDSHDGMSCDVTKENRTDENRKETTTDEVRLLLSGTVLSNISDLELKSLVKRHGTEHLLLAADVAAETCRRERKDIRNPGGYLQSLCVTLVTPEWYIPLNIRILQTRSSQERKAADFVKENTLKVQEEEQSMLRNSIWESLTDEERNMFRSEVLSGMPANMPPELLPEASITAMAKLLAWESNQVSNHA